MSEGLIRKPSEAIALDDLKAKIDDPHLPSLDLAAALDAVMKRYAYNQKQLAEALGMPQKRPLFSQYLSLLELKDEVKATLKGKVLGPNELRRILKLHSNTDNTPNNIDNTADNTDNTADNTDNAGENTSKESLQAIKSPDNTGSGRYPLIRDSFDLIGRAVFFWVKDSGLGDIAERLAVKLAEARRTQMVLLLAITLLSGYGTWRLEQDLPIAYRRWRASSYHIPLTTPSLPAPIFTSTRLISGHRMELRWPPAAPGTRHQVYWTNKEGDPIQRLGGDFKDSIGAVVNISYDEIHRDGFLMVTAIAPDDSESPRSERVVFNLDAMNQGNSVEPILAHAARQPETGAERGVRSSGEGSFHEKVPPPAPRIPNPVSLLSPPTGLHAEVKTPDLIILSWHPVAKDAKYNVYSFSSAEMLDPRKENPRPMLLNSVKWVPETGLDRYWIVVTVLGENGQESKYSEAIEVIRHPDKSGPSFAEQAAGSIRKVMPW